MKRDEVIRTLQAHGTELAKQHRVKSLAVFGSLARDDAAETSDVDLIVEFDRPIGLLAFARLRRYLSELLGTEVDLVTPNALREEMREQVLREAIRAA